MSEKIEDLIEQWERFREQGRHISAEQLCKDSPELLPEVKWQIQALQAVGSVFGSTKGAHTTPHDETDVVSHSQRLSTLLHISTEYQLLQHHASGGLGDVFLGTDTRLGRRVAIKFPKARTQSAEQLRRFEREALITGRLDHPGIVAVHTLNLQDPNQPCYVMRFIDGPTLQQRIAEFSSQYQSDQTVGKYHTLEFRQLLQAMIAVCNIAAYAHGQNVIHRDIKPANIILGPFGETYLLDWGLAKLVGEAEPSHTAESGPTDLPEMTKTGQTMGTPEFASPEQLLGKVDSIDRRSDVFSLGATFFYLLTGNLPLQQTSMSKYLKQISSETTSLMNLPAPIPKPLAAICRAATHIAPNLRYSNALDMAQDIQRYLAQEPISVMRETLLSRSLRWFRSHRATAATAAIGLLLALVASVAGLTVLSRLNLRLEKSNNDLLVSNASLEESNLAEQRSRAQAEEYFEAAATAVEEFLVEVSDNEQLQQTDFTDLRRSLLNSSRPFLEELRDRQPGNLKVETTRVKAMAKLASIDQETGKLDDAMSGLSQCISVAKQLFDKDQSNLICRQIVADCSYRLGLINSGHGQPQVAREHFSESIEWRRGLSNDFPENQKFASDLALAQVALGNLLRGQRDNQEARKQYEEAILICNRWVEKLPDDPDCSSALASALEQYGLLLSRIGERPQSLEKRLEALSIREELTKRFPDNLIYRTKLALNSLNVGVLLVESGKWDESQEYYVVARDILKQLVRDFPSNPIYSEHLAKVFNNLGNAVGGKGDLNKGLEYHQQSMAINLQLRERYPKNFDYIVGLGGSYSNLGYFQVNLDPEKSLSWFEKAIATFREAEAIDSKDYTLRTFFRNTMDAWANALNALGRFGQAAEVWKQAAGYDDGGRAKTALLDKATKAEALATLSSKFELVLAGEGQAESTERIQFAQFCHLKKLYRRAANEYAIAFQDQPELQKEFGYNAACSAALALNENATVATEVDQLVEMSRRARELLMSDLARIKAGAPSDQRILQHWLADPDLGVVRDANFLAKLSEQDRVAWEMLWTEVRLLTGK